MEKRVIEISAADVDQAIAQGLAKLGVSRDDVTVEILDEGSKGLLGFGKRDAHVRLITMIQAAEKSGPVSAPGRVTSPDVPSQKAEQIQEPADGYEASGKLSPSLPRSESASRSGPQELSGTIDQAVLDQEMRDEVEIAERVVSTLLDKMQVEAELATRFSEPDDVTGQRIPILDVHGKDLSVLIGPRGDTLSSFQYVSRLMVSHEIKRRSHFVIDVEGYRERRNQALQRLSERMAKKAVKRGKPVTLEPMPANERRAIHVSLRDHDAVYTESVGEGEARRVRILLKP